MNITYVTTPFGTTAMLSSEDVIIGVSTQKGMRISYISAFGGDNICLCDEDKRLVTQLPDGRKWYQLGGHRLWKSPEDYHCYYNDNAAAKEDELTDNAYTVTGEPTSDGLSLRMQIEFVQSNVVKVTHTLTNLNEHTVTAGLWGITALAPYGTAVLPYDEQTEGLTPNRNLVLWPYTDLGDERLTLANNGVAVTPRKNTTPLKVGVFNKQGVIWWQNNDLVMEIKCDVPQGNYPDYQCNVECYTNSDLLEIETLSPLYEIHPFESKQHIEYWTFTKK